MATLNTPKVIRRVRQRLQLSQEGLSRVLNATKGAIQHWERGRNNPDLARLLALRQICPPGPERKELDALVKQTQAQVAPLSNGPAGKVGGEVKGSRYAHLYADPSSLRLLRRENARLQHQVARFESTVKKKTEQLRILDDLVKDLQREISGLRGKQPAKSEAAAAGSGAAGL
jgi:transcriptional regulator with XRE-family HTH domain